MPCMPQYISGWPLPFWKCLAGKGIYFDNQGKRRTVHSLIAYTPTAPGSPVDF